MDLAGIGDFISSFGFPILCVIALAWFVYYMFKTNREENAKNMKAVQQSCQEREDKLYKELAEGRAVNTKAIEAIAMSVDKLSRIQDDISDIKTDVAVLMSKVN